MSYENYRNAIIGAIVGDALGVPYEFKQRRQIKDIGMIPDERRGLPEGTWSDDTSMILCNMQSMIENGINLCEIGDTFVRWYDENLWTPYGRVFDIGNTTSYAMELIKEGIYDGRKDEFDCGNGSLMRILPGIIWNIKSDKDDRMKYVELLSSLTHSHIKCLVGCNIYSEFMTELFLGTDKFLALDIAIENVKSFYTKESLYGYEEILNKSFLNKTNDNLLGSGYIISTLETTLWIVLNSVDYRSSVIKAIKVGGDTDTIASLVGASTGLIYGDVPKLWVDELARKNDIMELIDLFICKIK